MTSTHSWLELVDHAVEVFNGDTPHPAQEQAVLARFMETPARVAAMVDQIGAKVAAGKVRSGWTILALELERAAADVVVSDSGEREKQLRLAEAWLRNAGCQFDRADEVVRELFGERGRLRAWPELEQRLVRLWVSLHGDSDDEGGGRDDRRGDAAAQRAGGGEERACEAADENTQRGQAAGAVEGRGDGLEVPVSAGDVALPEDRFDLGYYDVIEIPDSDGAEVS